MIKLGSKREMAESGFTSLIPLQSRKFITVIGQHSKIFSGLLQPITKMKIKKT